RVAVRLTPPYDAVNVTVFAATTADVAIANDAVDDPAGTVTAAGADAVAESELATSTTTPPEGAAPLNVTDPAAPAPPATDAGETVNPVSAGGFTIRVADLVTPR